MSKPWQPYARHILDAIEKIRRIEMRGDLPQDDILYDAALRNLQTLAEATQLLPQSLRDRSTDCSMATDQRLPQHPRPQLSREYRPAYRRVSHPAASRPTAIV